MARIAMITSREDVGEDRYDEFDALAPASGRVGGPLGILLHVPDVAGRVLGVGRAVFSNSTMTPGERELATIVVARETDCAFTWATHVVAARKGGVSDETIAAVGDRADLSAFGPADRGIVEFTRAVVDDHRADDAIYLALVAERGERWVLDLTAVIAQILFLATVMNVFEVEAPEGAEALPA